MESKNLRKGFVEQLGFTSGVKGWGSDRLWERRQGLWWGNMYKVGWFRRVKTIRLTE